MEKINDLKIAKELGLKDVKAFRLNEDDAIAAYSMEEAKAWYMELTGLNDEEAFYDFEPEELNLDEMIWEDESMKNKLSIQQAIERYWDNEPFIVVSWAV